jgi:hypothetical protein
LDFRGGFKVTLIDKLANSQLYTEYKSNKRLQWMLAFIVLIIVISLLKQFSDKINQQRSETLTQINLLARLTQSTNNSIDENVISKQEASYVKVINTLPKASSASTAEAQALTEIEKILGELITRKRLNLLGSEPLGQNLQAFWTVRIEVSGQLSEKKLIDLLKYFDSEVQHRRIASFQYSPKISNTINLVIDLMYMRATND